MCNQECAPTTALEQFNFEKTVSHKTQIIEKQNFLCQRLQDYILKSKQLILFDSSDAF